MGLDMYAYTVPAEKLGDQQVDFDAKDFGEITVQKFAYWRKFNHLHGWMEDLYREKGGKGEDFNCDTVRLMPEDIDRLESEFNAGKLQARQGFFWGSGELYPEDVESLKDFISNSREAFKNGLGVIYTSWW